jgi:tetratricopeptide (TPR) repeat protein
VDNHVREGLLTLQRVSLVHLDKAETSHRLQMLAPIRHFCEQTLQTPEQTPEILGRGLISFYAKMLRDFTNVTDSAGHAIIPAELRHMHALFVPACKRHTVDHLVVHACIQYTEWSLYIGNPVEEVIRLTMDGEVGSPGLLATLGCVSFRRSKLDEAQASFERAIELRRQTHSVLGEANDVQKLGVVYLRRDELNAAQEFLERAIELH